MKLGRKVAKYIEENLTIGQGRRAGEPFKLLAWQKRFLNGAFGVKGSAAMSMARANGKSTFIAAIMCACIDPEGPLFEPAADNLIVAADFKQGGVIFRFLLNFMRGMYDVEDRRIWRKVESANTALLEHKATGARVVVLGANPDTMHGFAPRFVAMDEVARWKTKTDATLAALRTSMGKIPDSRYIAIGTRPANPDHPFQRMLDGGAAFALQYAPGADDPPFQKRTWKKANPSLDHLPDLLAEIKLEAELARKDPSLMPEFQSLRLNMGVSETAQMTLLDADTWRRLENMPEAPREGPYILGLDLGQNASMTAAAAYWPHTGALDSFAVFPEEDPLPQRGLKDGVGSLYIRMHQRGELHVAGHRVADYRYLLRTVLAKWGRPLAIACDRYRDDDLLQVLDDCGFPRAKVVFRGMGYKDNAEDVRKFRAACLNEEVNPPVSLLIRSAMYEARCAVDESGNQKLYRGHGGGGSGFKPKDDVAVAVVHAVAEGVRFKALNPRRQREPRFAIV